MSKAVQIADRITINPDICNGEPTIRGLRITVKTILDYLSQGDSTAEILNQYPSLSADDILAAIKYAADLVERTSIKTYAA